MATLLAWDISANPFGSDLPVWFWQTTLVLPGLVLAARPLVRDVMGSGWPTGSAPRNYERPGPFPCAGGLIRLWFAEN